MKLRNGDRDDDQQGQVTVPRDVRVEIEVEDEESVDLALRLARQGADFADALIAKTNELYGCTETVTFDRKAAAALGWRLLA